MIIRSVTLHVDSVDSLSKGARVLADLSKAIARKGYSVWSRRISLPPIEDNRELLEICRAIADLRRELEGLYISAFNFRASTEISIPDLVKCMKGINTSFSSMLVKGEDDLEEGYKKLSDFYRSSEVDLHTRFATIYGTWILTPYFPASASIVSETAFTVALRYARDFRDSLSKGSLKMLGEAIENLNRDLEESSGETGVGYKGIDLSLSPWMEESVGAVIEDLSGAEIPLPGTIAAIRKVNKIISRDLVRRARSTGFGEVMLPVEEDNVLKERARLGKISLKDLIGYAAFCVAGVDMAVIPRSRVLSGKTLYNIMEDLLQIYQYKQRPMGMRIIVADSLPGMAINLGRFGVASVIEI
ncbi:MAG: DUF711 family protein [Desulfurococcales archaeon]|jgi:uncharacterized protein (UPF0210 family)